MKQLLEAIKETVNDTNIDNERKIELIKFMLDVFKEDGEYKFKTRKCPFCKSPIESEDEPCIFCDGEGCRLCADNNGKTTIVWCTSKDCILSDDEE
jgi:hypothetical protein